VGFGVEGVFLQAQPEAGPGFGVAEAGADLQRERFCPSFQVITIASALPSPFKSAEPCILYGLGAPQATQVRQAHTINSRYRCIVFPPSVDQQNTFSQKQTLLPQRRKSLS